MIKFTLKCAEDHQFESWFQSSEAYDKLAAANMVSCAVCGSGSVTKAMMAPTVRASRTAATAPANPVPDASSDTPMPTAQPGPGALSKPQNPKEAALAELKKQVEENSEYVGMNFATQARDMHDGTAPARAIHGEAKPEEARKLIEDGVPVLPLPFVPGRKSN